MLSLFYLKSLSIINSSFNFLFGKSCWVWGLKFKCKTKIKITPRSLMYAALYLKKNAECKDLKRKRATGFFFSYSGGTRFWLWNKTSGKMVPHILLLPPYSPPYDALYFLPLVCHCKRAKSVAVLVHMKRERGWRMKLWGGGLLHTHTVMCCYTAALDGMPREHTLLLRHPPPRSKTVGSENKSGSSSSSSTWRRFDSKLVARRLDCDQHALHQVSPISSLSSAVDIANSIARALFLSLIFSLFYVASLCMSVSAPDKTLSKLIILTPVICCCFLCW